jgi:hypothetical protein
MTIPQIEAALEAVERKIEVTVVGKRCVYLNDYRICGGKPWVSENLPQHDFKTSIKDVLHAVGFPLSAIRALVDEHKRFVEVTMWRPIESAPRDETSIHAWCTHGQYILSWKDDFWVVDDNKSDFIPLRGEEPTHWMSLPPSPEANITITEGQSKSLHNAMIASCDSFVPPIKDANDAG